MDRLQAALYEISRELVMTSGVEALGEIAVRHVRALLGTDVAIFLDGQPPSAGLEIPLIGARGSVGVLVAATTEIDPMKRRTLDTMVAQTALAIERAQLATEAENAHVAAETERTRNTLLAGLSHDLRTRLLAIGGSADVLLDSEDALDPDQRRALLTTVRDEAQKLTRFVTGMLDLVRFESGTVRVVKEWCPVEEILSSAIGRLERALDGRPVRTSLGDTSELLMVPADPSLLEQVFVNLLDNAARYTPKGSPIEIIAKTENATLRIEVVDHGRGISPGDEKRVFEKFYRSERSAKESSGAGLGLALCEAIVRAHGGSIEARRGVELGSVFTVSLPLDVPPLEAGELSEETGA